MVRDHIFISYAQADGAEFAMRLYADLRDHDADAWLDIHNIPPGANFDSSIDMGLEEAKTLLVLLTPVSVISPQVQGEWNEALNRFIPILPLLVRSCQIPRTLKVFEYIDFIGSYEEPLKKLLERLKTLEADHLKYLQQTLSALNKAKREAPDPRRFQPKIRALRRKVAEFEQRVQLQRDRIAAGMESQRLQKARTVKGVGRSRPRVVGKPPLDVAELFRDRVYVQVEVSRLLVEASTRMVSIIGRGGMGKTALAVNVLLGLEQNRWPHTDQEIAVKGIVYLSTRTSGISLERLFLDCATMLSGSESVALNKVWANHELEPDEKVMYLLESLTGGLYVILLDNLEDLLDDNGNLLRSDLRSFIEAALQTKSGPRLLVTSRIALVLRPELTRLDQRVTLQDGLPVPDGVALLRDLDPHEEYGLKTAPPDLLARFVGLVHRVPRALEVTAGILANNPFLALDDLLQDFYLQEDVVQKLIKDNYRQLDPDARRVMDAVAVFGRPVSVLALDYLLEPFVPGLNVPEVIKRLVRSHILIVDRIAKTVTMHPIDQDYAYTQLPESGKYNRLDLELRAAAWYRSQQKRRGPEIWESDQWRSIHDLESNILEFEHTLRVGAYDQAMKGLAVFGNFLTWNGHAGRVRDMLARLDGKLQDEHAQMLYSFVKGDNEFLFGDLDQSQQHLQDALELSRNMPDPEHEARILLIIAGIDNSTGNVESAIEKYHQALALFRRVGNGEGEKYSLFDLGLAYAGRRNARESLRYAQQMQDFANRTGALLDYGLSKNIFAVAFILNRNWQAALDASQQLLEIYPKANKEIWIPGVLNMLGIACLGLGKLDEASHYLQSGFAKAMDLDYPAYVSSRCAFNLTWTLYQSEKSDEALAVIGKSRTLSKQIRELGSIDALSRAVEAYKKGDVSGEARALLDCARVSQDNIDLWDPCDIALKARELAHTVRLEALKVEAQSFINAFNAKLAPPE